MAGSRTGCQPQLDSELRRLQVPEKDDVVKKENTIGLRNKSAGSRIIAGLQEAVAWAEGKEIAVRVSTAEALITVKVATIAVRESLLLSV